MKPAIRLILVALAASFAIGCFSSEPAKRRGPLGDAVEKASDDNEGTRVVDTRPTTVPSSEDDDDSDDAYETVATVVSTTKDTARTRPARAVRTSPRDRADTAKSRVRVWLSVAGGPGLTGGSAFSELSSGTLRIGGEIGDRSHVDLVGTVHRAPLQTSTALFTAIHDDILILSGGAEYRWYTTPRHTALGHYLMGGLGFTSMSWDYRNAIISGADVIRDDQLSGFELYLGTGLEIVRTSRFRFGVEALPGVMLWGQTTSQGFDNQGNGGNDFDAVPYIKLRATMGLRVSED